MLDNRTYDIYASSALGEITSTEAYEALLDLVRCRGRLADYVVEPILAQGRAEAIPLLVRNLEADPREVANALYTLSALHGLEGPEMDRWRDLFEKGSARGTASPGLPATIREGQPAIPGWDFVVPSTTSPKKAQRSRQKAARKKRKAEARKNRKRR